MSYDEEQFETFDHVVTLHLTKEGKLPRWIDCSVCRGSMRRLVTRSAPGVVTFRCQDPECGAVTVLDTNLT